MSIIDHIFLFSILFMSFYLVTRIPQNNINRDFWKLTSFLIILYSVILGCRYGWGNDYLWYKSRFENPYAYSQESTGFRILNVCLDQLGLNYIGAYMVYSLLYIVTAFSLLKNYETNKYMIALFLPATLLQSTFTIRQSVAHSFVFLSILCLNGRQWIKIGLYLILSYLIHPAGLLLFIPVFFFSLFYNKIFSIRLSIPVYIFASVATNIINAQIVSLFSQYLPLLSLGNKFDSYLQDEMWFGEEAIQYEYLQGTVTLILSMLFHISIIYIGFVALKYKPCRNIISIYNTVVVGLILTRVFFVFEIFRRMTEPLMMMYFIPLGYSLFFLLKNIYKIKKIEVRLSIISVVIISIYLILYFGRFILQSPDYKFFWNIN